MFLWSNAPFKLLWDKDWETCDLDCSLSSFSSWSSDLMLDKQCKCGTRRGFSDQSICTHKYGVTGSCSGCKNFCCHIHKEITEKCSPGFVHQWNFITFRTWTVGNFLWWYLTSVPFSTCRSWSSHFLCVVCYSEVLRGLWSFIKVSQSQNA